MYRQWRQAQVSWEDSRDSVQLYRDEDRKAKAQMELNLRRDTKRILRASTGMSARIGRPRRAYLP